MKSKKQFVIIVSLMIVLIVCLVCLFIRFEGYYIFYREPLPDSGIWHNESLNMDIDFDYLSNYGGNCVTVYSNNGKTKTEYNFGTLERGNSIEIHPIRDGYIIGYETLLEGTYKYYDNRFIITSSEGIVYEFSQVK